MSEKILKTLMQLFAIIARVGGSSRSHREIVQLFLKQQITLDLVRDYLSVYDQFLEEHTTISDKKFGSQKRTSLNSVKILRICTQINKELKQKQKIIVLVRLIEFINIAEEENQLQKEFINTVAETFNIPTKEFLRINLLIKQDKEALTDEHFLIIDDKRENLLHTKHIYNEGFSGEVRILRIESVKMFILRYYGEHELYLNGQIINTYQTYILSTGSSIRNRHSSPIYYSDVISSYLSDKDFDKIIFKANNISYQFQGGTYGLNPLNLIEESGNLVGIMGGSGVGKSTLINVLNGNLIPTNGSVTINGVSIHNHSVEGLIGYVSQDDLLIEELTVFENLYYNAKLCFGDLSRNQTAKKVDNLLQVLGLSEIKNLKVGTPLQKIISGGQRKRLNIALELIREPSVLFIDEPTSGLSSRDSENIMDLLKELTLKGKLIFVVIHQPSSDLFKMFDQLMILDTGGYLIYNGNPIDSIVYFKSLVNYANRGESECARCGNVNPEQIFNIIESKVVDEYGNITNNRKVNAQEWRNFFLEKKEEEKSNEPIQKEVPQEVPESEFHIPSKLKQFSTFFVRDVLSKMTNRQYLLINLLEAPILAAILAFFIKFFNSYNDRSLGYIFRENENLPQYLFISVVVALFLGLTVSAEEIIRDKKILRRESFLNLSRGSYLVSKTFVVFLISGVQILQFVLVGNWILEIEGMGVSYWLILFSTACFSNMLGLNISASFNSAKVIYILIPILIIPQLLFSGIIVKFDKLHPLFSSESQVPVIGNVMASRWAYEALAVTQFKDNEFEKQFFQLDKRRKYANWKKDFWIKDMKNKLAETRRVLRIDPELVKKDAKFTEYFDLIREELKKENKVLKDLKFSKISQLKADEISVELINELRDHLKKLTIQYREVYRAAEKEKQTYIAGITDTPEKKAAFVAMKDTYKNESLEEIVTNSNELKAIATFEGKLVQKSNPIYTPHYHFNFFDSPFYAPQKKCFGNVIDTFWANIITLWGMTLILAIMLQFDILAIIIDRLSSLKLRKYLELNIKTP